MEGSHCDVDPGGAQRDDGDQGQANTIDVDGALCTNHGCGNNKHDELKPTSLIKAIADGMLSNEGLASDENVSLSCLPEACASSAR